MSAPAAQLFPATESWKQTVDILNGELPEKQLKPLAESAVQSLLGTIPPTPPSDPAERIALAAFVFIFRQLVFHGLSANGEDTTSALSSACSVGKAAVSLKKAVIDVIAAEWATHCKTLGQNARQETIAELCHRKQATGPAYVHITTEIEMGSGAVVEDDTAEDGVNYFASTTHHAPKANIFLPPTEHHVGGAQLSLGKQETYNLFVELDAVQRAIDTLLGHTASS